MLNGTICASGFINCTETIGVVIGTATVTTFGDIFLPLFTLMIFLMAMAMLFGIKMEYTAILIFPLLLSYMAFYGKFVAVGSVMLIYISLIITKRFIFK